MNILEHYNPDKLKINDPVNLDDDTYFCKFSYNNMPFIIKTNKICYIKKRLNESKFINVSLTSPDYLLWYENFYKFCIEYVYNKNDDWFEDKLSKSEIEFSFINPLKSNIKESCFDVQCLMDENRLHVIDSNDNVTNIDSIEQSKVIPSFHIKGIKFNNKYFMFDIELSNLYIILDEPRLVQNLEQSNDIPKNEIPKNEIPKNEIINGEMSMNEMSMNEINEMPTNEDNEDNELEENNSDLENIEELNLQSNDLESSNININNKEFYKVYELVNNKIKEDIINNLRSIFINKKIKNNIDLFELIEDEEDN
jgi:hypothetical protein